MSPTLSTLKRFILATLTIIVVIHMSLLLLGSLSEPQITSQLELYQTDLLLHATELKDESGADTGTNSVGNSDTRKALLGEDPLKTALDQYESVRQSAQKNLTQFQNQLAKVSGTLTPDVTTTPAVASSKDAQLRSAISQQRASINQLDLRIGILQAEKQDSAAAIQTWEGLKERIQGQADTKSLVETTDTLVGLWDNPPRLLPDAEQNLQKNLEGWFRYTALGRLYELQQRPDALAPLEAEEQAIARQTILKLALVSTAPLIGSLIGAGLLIFLVAQRLLRGKQSLFEQNATLLWEVPWDWETIVLVLVLGFFFVGQLVVPLALSVGQIGLSRVFSDLGSSLAFGGRAKALYALTYYLTMAAATLLVLYLSIKKFFPLPEGWFRFWKQHNWLLWGISGYFAALPLMILVSLINQQIWQGQGGSNPLLQIVLEEADPIALIIFFLTAAIAAPLFEETLFRGFLLPSLTRYVPVWAAIALSSLIFAIAHLSFSEVLPLTVLGSVLGFVYTRSRSLLAPMLLHSLWNSATMIGLFLLGSGTH